MSGGTFQVVDLTNLVPTFLGVSVARFTAKRFLAHLTAGAANPAIVAQL
jgi:hypothetical protein